MNSAVVLLRHSNYRQNWTTATQRLSDRFLAPASETDSPSDNDFRRQSDPRLSQQPRDIQAMLQRIEQLERKVATLEAQQAASRYPQLNAPIPPNNTQPNNTQPNNTQPNNTQHRYLRPELELPREPQRVSPNPPQGSPSPNWHTPPSSRTLPPTSHPQNRQRFNFNGQWFYIIPVEETNDAFDPRDR